MNKKNKWLAFAMIFVMLVTSLSFTNYGTRTASAEVSPISITSLDVQLDWSKVPQLEVGMDGNAMPSIMEAFATITGTGVKEGAYYDWAVKVDDSFKIANNVLVKYTGYDEIVTIPEGVTKIGSQAFGGEFPNEPNRFVKK